METDYFKIFRGRVFPDERLFHDISAPCEDDVVSLNRILTDKSLREHQSTANYPFLAAQILSKYQSEAAIPGIIDLLSCPAISDPVDLIPLLSAYGEPMTELLIAKFSPADPELKIAYSLVLSKAGIKNDLIFAILIQEFNKGSVLAATCLANYGDPCAIPTLSRKFNKQPLDAGNPAKNFIFEDISRAMMQLGGKLSPEQKLKLKRSRTLLDNHKKNGEILPVSQKVPVV